MSNALMKLRRELDRYQALEAELAEHPDIDPQALLDTLEGETEVNEALLLLATEVDEIDGLVAGITIRTDRLYERKARLQRTKETLRNVILSAMDKAGIPNVRGDGCTLSVRKTPPGLVIEDEAQIPSDYFKLVPKLDKKAVKEALDYGDSVPGAQLNNGGIALTMRIK